MSERKCCHTCKYLGNESVHLMKAGFVCMFPFHKIPYAYRRDNESRIVSWKVPWVNSPKQWGKNCPTYEAKP